MVLWWPHCYQNYWWAFRRLWSVMETLMGLMTLWATRFIGGILFLSSRAYECVEANSIVGHLVILIKSKQWCNIQSALRRTETNRCCGWNRKIFLATGFFSLGSFISDSVFVFFSSSSDAKSVWTHWRCRWWISGRAFGCAWPKAGTRKAITDKNHYITKDVPSI